MVGEGAGEVCFGGRIAYNHAMGCTKRSGIRTGIGRLITLVYCVLRTPYAYSVQVAVVKVSTGRQRLGVVR